MDTKDKSTEKNGKTKRGDKRQLKRPEDLRLFLASLVHQVKSNKMAESKARCLTYIIQNLLIVMRDSELEKRLEEIEKKLNGG